DEAHLRDGKLRNRVGRAPVLLLERVADPHDRCRPIADRARAVAPDVAHEPAPEAEGLADKGALLDRGARGRQPHLLVVPAVDVLVVDPGVGLLCAHRGAPWGAGVFKASY